MKECSISIVNLRDKLVKWLGILHQGVFNMRKKTCPYCKTISYGSSDKNWICPHCKKDISHISSKSADVDKLDLDEFLSKVKLPRILLIGN